ncbi:kazal-type serine protease inhibitor domain-containing protein 1-like [Polymixia lowei]
MTQLWLCVYTCVCVSASLGLPPQHRGWLRLWEEGEGCGECDRQLCPAAPNGCPAGLVRDNCGCCEQCANVEGQQCDPDGAQKFYGRCGEGLVCRRKTTRRGHRGGERADPEPACACRDAGPVCGSDGRTYPNLCRLREAASRSEATLKPAGQGPCYSAPRILRAPRDLSNYTGNDVVLGCEVSAYPLPHLNWRKKGSDYFLPGDDPHVSVQIICVLCPDVIPSLSQTRGGPQRYMVSTWLQIQGLHLSDAGVYSCISHNALGETSASAHLTVLRRGVRVTKNRLEEKEEHYFDGSEEGSEDGQPASGDYLE